MKAARNAEQLRVDARSFLSDVKPTEAKALLQQYIENPRGTNKSVAEDLLRQLAVATSEADNKAALLQISDTNGVVHGNLRDFRDSR